MQNSTIVILIALAVAVLLGAWFVWQRRRTESLRHRFGPEYERAVREHGGPRKAEAALDAREKRVEKLHIVSLRPAARDQFAASWKAAQARFVDDPKAAIQDADRL